MTTVRQRIDESWESFLEVLNSVPEERLEEPGACGDWSLKDLMAHIAFWDDIANEGAHAKAAGNAPKEFDWREANDREAALRAAWSLKQSRDAMVAAHQRVLDATDQYPELGSEYWQSSTFEHYDEHAADIREWLDRGEGNAP